MKSCTGCKACVTACHSLNGLDEGESWRQTGLLVGDRKSPGQQTITSSCHHCLDPACLEGCPVLAYDKDPVTGIVRHLDDQCIGCQYCVLTCPYQVPQYSAKRGIVRKCDMCSQRLASNEAPACVQACPNSAITIRVISKEELRAKGDLGVFLPASPTPQRTFPTTTYSGTETLPLRARRSDQNKLIRNQLHFPLVLMLVLSQAAAGMLVFQFFSAKPLSPYLILGIASAGALASAFHLGRPFLGWRAFLGWRKSWLSREVIAYGVWLCLLLLCSTPFSTVLTQVTAAMAGIATVYCSIRVYQKTGHRFWSWFHTGVRFGGTVFIIGAVASENSIASVSSLLCKLLIEIGFLRHAQKSGFHEINRSAQLIIYKFPGIMWLRIVFALLALGGVLFSQFGLALILMIVSEICERAIFFGALSPDKMPS